MRLGLILQFHFLVGFETQKSPRLNALGFLFAIEILRLVDANSSSPKPFGFDHHNGCHVNGVRHLYFGEVARWLFVGQEVRCFLPKIGFLLNEIYSKLHTSLMVFFLGGDSFSEGSKSYGRWIA